MAAEHLGADSAHVTPVPDAQPTAASGNPLTVINFSEARERMAKRKQSPSAGGSAWKNCIDICCAYARLVRAEHAAESARIRFDQLERHVTEAWWEGPADLKQRIHANNAQWDVYIALLRHIAALPATTRSEAANKRSTIPKMWLTGHCAESALFAPLRAGCLRDDHLFPPSMKLARG